MLWAVSASLTAQNGARRLTVREVEIEGNRAIDDFALRASIETTASAWLARFPLTRWVGWGRRPAFDEIEFRRDVLRLLVLYRQTGYINARVDTVVTRGRDHVDVRFMITEGEPVRVTSLTVSGTEGIIPPAQLIRDLPLREGDPFDQGRLIVSTDSIQRALRWTYSMPLGVLWRTTTLVSIRFQSPGLRATLRPWSGRSEPRGRFLLPGPPYRTDASAPPNSEGQLTPRRLGGSLARPMVLASEPNQIVLVGSWKNMCRTAPPPLAIAVLLK